jgi:hypothetical protein
VKPKYFRSGNKVMYVDQIGNMRVATEEEIENNYINGKKVYYYFGLNGTNSELNQTNVINPSNPINFYVNLDLSDNLLISFEEDKNNG